MTEERNKIIMSAYLQKVLSKWWENARFPAHRHHSLIRWDQDGTHDTAVIQ